MKEFIIEKPKLTKKYKSPFSASPKDIDRMNRRRIRAGELGIRLFVLDGNIVSDTLQELENRIVDEYIDKDIDVPEELKKEYLELKKKIEEENVSNDAK